VSGARTVRFLLATLGLLALATSASAECAWVLWSEHRFNLLGPKPLPETHEWVAVMADSPKAKCEAEAAWKIKDAAKPSDNKRERVEVTGNVIFRTLYPVEGYGEQPSAVSTPRFVCLPDTVDPRGPKGK
jgi:hypothetical protein